MVLYASGTALNDVFDVEIDRRTAGPAAAVGSSFLAGRRLARRPGPGDRPVLALASGSLTSAVVAAILAGCILAMTPV